MLKNVHIKNLALIAETDIDFEKSLNILTGETGAGKSIIISSINIGLGDKANKGIIRNGEKEGLVELTFVTQNKKVFDALDSLGIERDGENVTIKRKISADSSISKINGESVTLANLKMITSMLVDVHGQHDHQSLLDSKNHINIVDDFGGTKLLNAKEKLQEKYYEYKALKKELDSFNMNEDELAKEKELLLHELKEIEDAAIKENEDEELETEFKKLSNAEKIHENTNKANININDENDGAITKINVALKEITQALKFDESLDELRKQILDLDSVIKDVGHDLNHYIDNNAFDPQRFSEVRDRLNQINHLKDRYGKSVKEISEYANNIKEKLDKYENYSQKREELISKQKDLASEVNEKAKKLSQERKKAASKLEPMIIENLQDLNFLNCEFKINFEKASKITAAGFDNVEFLISTNPGEPIKPLSKVASGGELSRIMLSIKSSVAKADNIETLIFDEIDTGISGNTAYKVAEKLDFLSKTHQIICITHLPQIASMADYHFEIQKSVQNGNTISGIKLLSDKESDIAIAKLLGGDKVTNAALENAVELKKASKEAKK